MDNNESQIFDEDNLLKKKDNHKFNKKLLGYSLGIFLIVITLFGTTYAYFIFNGTDSREADMVAGEVYVKVNESNLNLTINGYPMTKEEAREAEDNYIDFTVSGKNTTMNTIYYEMDLVYGSNKNNYIRFNDSDLVFDLSEIKNGVEDRILSAESYASFDNKKVWVDTINANQTTVLTRTYRLRVWLRDDIIISDTDPEATYSTTGTNAFNKHYATISIKVVGDFNEKTLSEGYDKIKSLAIQGATYIASYDDIITSNPTFTTQDQVETNSSKKTVYYYTGSDAAANANVLFAGFCWQIIRTTDNGGIRMIYNGVAENSQCETTRTVTKGINAIGDGTTQSMTSASLYGRGYDYNLATGEFTIEDSTGLPTSWSTSDANNNGTEDYKELIGTYTCLSNSDTCTTLYYVGSINESNTAQAYVVKYTIGDVAHFSQLGTSAFNPNRYSPALVGYMFNTEYDYKYGSKSGEYYTAATWNGTTYDLTTGNGGTDPDVTHHYICDTDCTKVRFYYYVSGSNYYYYILLENGMTIEDAIYQMTGNGTTETKAKTINANYELNNYNSSIKGYLDNWYKKNLTGYTSYLDGTSVYCNNRSISELGGWNPNGTTLTGTLKLYQYNVHLDLNCVNETDRFAATNNKAKLSYPIGLLTEPERNLITFNFAKTGQSYLEASPFHFSNLEAAVRSVYTSGDAQVSSVNFSLGSRGVVTLKPGTRLESGTGTYTDPYVIE